MRVNLPLIFSQWDSRWSDKFLGFNQALPYNIYNFGCLLTDLATLCNYYGFNETPDTLNEKLKALGDNKGFTKGGGEYVWGAITKVHSEIKEKKTDTPSLLTDAQMIEIRTALDNGSPVILQIDYNPKTVANDTHYVIAVDYNASDENDLTIADPLGGRNRSLKDYLGFLVGSARRTISQYSIYTGPKPADNGDMMLVPKSVWPNVVHGSDQWDKTVAEYKPGNDPKTTQFEDVQRVISGYKSQVTDLQNRLDDTVKNLAIANAENSNKDEQVGRLKAQVLEQTKRIDELQKAQSDLTGQYEAKLAAKQGEVDQAFKDKGKALNDLAACQASASQGAEDSNLLNLLSSILKKIINR